MRQNVPMSDASQARWSLPGPAPTPTIGVWLIVSGIGIRAVLSVLTDHATNFDNPELPAIRPPAWAQAFTRASYVLILVAAVLYVTAPAAARLGRHYRVLICAWIGYSLLLAARNLQLQDCLTSAVWFLLAPGCAIASCWMFASADKDSWRKLVQIVSYGSVGISLITLFEVTQLRSVSRGEAYSRLYTYSSILEITAIVAFAWFTRTRRTWLGIIPVAALIAATIAMQTRLMVIELVFLLFFYRIFSQRKISANGVVALCLGGLLLVGLVYIVWYTPATLRSVVPASASSFWDRSTQDTRSAQFVTFFQNVSPSALLLGIGIPRQGEFDGLGEKGIDVGYVNILFIGGVPALVLFFVIHLMPAVRSLGSRFDTLDAACLASVMTYGVRLFSSTVPGITPGYLILVLLIGRCAMLTRENKHRSRSGYFNHTTERFLMDRETVEIASKA
jgi:hypothetical protein